MKENNEEVKEEKTKKEPDVKTKRKKAKIAVLSLSTLVVLFVGLQVYASTNGYGNVFFMIKEWVTGEKVTEEGKIFSDQEITLSYKSIDLAEGLKIQVNRLEIKDGKTKLYANVKSEKSNPLPLKYEMYSESKEGANVTSSSSKKITGVMPKNEEYYSYTEALELDYAIKENATLIVKISDSSDKELKTLEINLETREITVKGEEKLEKISKVELRKYLDAFSLLNDPSNYTESDNLIEISTKIQAITESKLLIKRETINEIVKEFYGENAKFELVKDAQGKNVEVLKDMRVKNYDKECDDYESMEHDRLGKCLKIESASYENGVYTIKYIYTLANQFDEDKDNLEDLPQYETTIQLKRVEGNKYSKYQIVSIGNATQIKEKVNTTITEETQNNEDDFEYIFGNPENDNTNTNQNVTNDNNGTNTGNNADNSAIPYDSTIEGLRKQSYKGSFTDSQNAKIAIGVMGEEAYQTIMHSEYYTYNDRYGNSINIKGIKYISQPEFVQTNIDADKALFRAKIIYTKENNSEGDFEIAVVLSKDFRGEILGCYDSFRNSEEFREFAGLATSIEFTSSDKWKEFGSYLANIQYKIPDGFTFIPSWVENSDEVYYTINGNCLLRQNENGAPETVPVKITVTNAYTTDGVRGTIEFNDADRCVESDVTESEWSKWAPVTPNSEPEQQGVIKRWYARIKKVGDVQYNQEVKFEMQTPGISTDHYQFMSAFLKTVRATAE